MLLQLLAIYLLLITLIPFTMDDTTFHRARDTVIRIVTATRDSQIPENGLSVKDIDTTTARRIIDELETDPDIERKNIR